MRRRPILSVSEVMGEECNVCGMVFNQTMFKTKLRLDMQNRLLSIFRVGLGLMRELLTSSLGLNLKITYNLLEALMNNSLNIVINKSNMFSGLCHSV